MDYWSAVASSSLLTETSHLERSLVPGSPLLLGGQHDTGRLDLLVRHSRLHRLPQDQLNIMHEDGGVFCAKWHLLIEITIMEVQTGWSGKIAPLMICTLFVRSGVSLHSRQDKLRSLQLTSLRPQQP